MKAVFIYALKCPITGAVRYIGKTSQPLRRLRLHIKSAKREKCHRAHWINSLINQGRQPEFEMLAQVPESEWQQWEIDYIEAFRSLGCDLVNSTPGGEGFRSGKNHPNFGKPGINRGRKLSPEWRAAIGAGGLGKRRLPESSAKATAKNRGQKRTLSQCARISASLKGRVAWNKGLDCPASALVGPRNPMFGKTPWNKGMKNGSR